MKKLSLIILTAILFSISGCSSEKVVLSERDYSAKKINQPKTSY